MRNGTDPSYDRLKIVLWVATVAWALEIFYLSTPRFGESLSRSLLIDLLDSLRFSVSSGTLDVLDSIFRKSAHLTEYAIFGLLLYGCFSKRTLFYWQPYAASWCVIVAALYSVTDELHQVFSPGRHPKLLDCCVDTAGAMIAMLLVYGGSQLNRTGKDFRH